MAREGVFEFVGYEIQCDVLGIPIPFDVPNCRTAFSSELADDPTLPPCPECDRTYGGAFVYSEDTCGELLEQASPTSGAFGFVFTSETEWEFFTINAESGGWESAGTAVDEGDGTYAFSTSAVLSDNPEDCDWPSDQDLGELTVTLSFQPSTN